MLGPLFLVSGMSTAAALVALLAVRRSEKELFTRIDLVLIFVELTFVALFLINLATGSGQQIEALQIVMGGSYTFVFWAVFIGIGLLIPMLLEIMELKGMGKSIAILAPVLVLIGGYALRQVVLDAGQESTWTSYPSQYNAELLQRLH